MAQSKRKSDEQKAKVYLAKLDIAKNSTDINPFETKAQQQERINRAKKDVVFFVETYLPHYATAKCAYFHIEFATMVQKDPLFKGFAEWGRGLAKSVWCDVIIPLWLWSRGEDMFFCLMSDSKERADELLYDVQAELEGNQLLIHDFGVQKCEGFWEFGNFQTIDQRFIGKGFGIKKKVRGVRIKQRRPTLWVIDDLETPDTISNHKRMLKQAKIIERDVIATMISENRRLLYANNKFERVMTQTILQERHPSWKVHQIKAYNKVTYEPAWASMYTAEFYKQQEIDMTVIGAYAEYLHETKLEGAIFSEEQIQWAELPPLEEFTMILAHWDIAYTDNEKSDYNAFKVWGLHGSNFWLIDCYVKQSKMKQAVAWICSFQKKLPSAVNFIKQYESQFWNGEVQRAIDEVENEYDIDLNMIKHDTPRVNKLGRIISHQPYYQNSRIYYNIALKSHSDTQVGIMQLCAIEEGSTEHDDSPDADQQAIATLENYVGSSKRRKEGEKSHKTGKMTQKYKLA
jgi:phage terminase large subunit-like protein